MRKSLEFTEEQVKTATGRAFAHCRTKFGNRADLDSARFNACVSGAATVRYVLTGDWEIALGSTKNRKRRR